MTPGKCARLLSWPIHSAQVEFCTWFVFLPKCCFCDERDCNKTSSSLALLAPIRNTLAQTQTHAVSWNDLPSQENGIGPPENWPSKRFQDVPKSVGHKHFSSSRSTPSACAISCAILVKKWMSTPAVGGCQAESALHTSAHLHRPTLSFHLLYSFIMPWNNKSMYPQADSLPRFRT